VYAYGDIGQRGPNGRKFGSLIRQRIVEVKAQMQSFPVPMLPAAMTSSLKNPKHPKQWKLSSRSTL